VCGTDAWCPCALGGSRKIQGEQALYYFSSPPPSPPQHPLDQRSAGEERLIMIITNAFSVAINNINLPSDPVGIRRREYRHTQLTVVTAHPRQQPRTPPAPAATSTLVPPNSGPTSFPQRFPMSIPSRRTNETGRLSFLASCSRVNVVYLLWSLYVSRMLLNSSTVPDYWDGIGTKVGGKGCFEGHI